MEKKCTKCKQVKPVSCFNKWKAAKDNLRRWCKSCSRQYWQDNYRTPPGKAQAMYRAMHGRIKHKFSYKSRTVEFTKAEFLEWLKTTQYKDLFDQWAASGYEQKLSPSIDRIDNDRSYTLENMQIITVGDNSSKTRVRLT